MKFELLILLFFTFSICNAQLKPVTISFRNGEILKGIGKNKENTFKYQIDENAKAQEFEFSTIKSVEVEISNDKKVTYKVFQVKDSEKFIMVKDLVLGSKAELYTTALSHHTPGGMSGMNVMGAMGGMGIGIGTGSQPVIYYFIKKPNEDKLTEMGAYNPLTSELKVRVKTYFSDCKSLIDKLNNREFKVGKGLDDIVTFYNENCE